MGLFARFSKNGESCSFQLCQDHSRNVARYTRDAMAVVGLPSLGYLTGLVHDMGKFKLEFTNYIEAIAKGESPTRGSVNHTFCAVRFILERYHTSPDSEEGFYRALASELVAIAVGSHHGQFDCIGPKKESGFDYRREKEGIGYEESVRNFLEQCASKDELDRLMGQAVGELASFIPKLEPLFRADGSSRAVEESDSLNSIRRMEAQFYYELLARLLLSALVDADRRDAAEFDRGATLPHPYEDADAIWEDCIEFAEARHAELRAAARLSALNEVRENVYLQCTSFAEERGGVYRLNVPTGGGKTLSVLAYALRHARIHGKRRIIFTFPLLTILDQNAKEIRGNVPEGKGYVVEHHSNIVQERPPEEGLDPRELLVETWDAPIVVTTLVQLLNTLFDGRGSCIRRFKALCNSVIVIDEVQTVPLKMLSLFNLAVNFLAETCGATVVLCSATQPCFEAVKHPIAGEPQDVVALDDEQKGVFKRTVLVDGGCRRLDEIASLGREVLATAQSLLIVCNKKDQARKLFGQLNGSAERCFHLSAGMCHAHREKVVEELKAALEESRRGGGKVLCVATQVVEAGVDLSFASAIRFSAGLDSIIQTAGRVNREGEQKLPCSVYIVSCLDESLSHLKDIRHAQVSTGYVLEDYSRQPEKYGNDLSSDAAVKAYFKQLYTRDGICLDSLDYPVDVHGVSTSLLSLLSVNDKLRNDPRDAEVPKYLFNQAFKTAGSYFRVFDDDTVDVLVPYGEEGERIIADFGSEGIAFDLEKQKELLAKAKRFSVALRRYQVEVLAKAGAIAPKCDGLVLALLPDFYDRDCGVVEEPSSVPLLAC